MWAETNLGISLICKSEGLVHFLGEAQIGSFRRGIAVPRYRIDTIHQPYPIWSNETLRQLSGLHHLLLLSSQDVANFKRHTGAEIHFIRHGVDTVFFRPGEPATPPRFLYNGVHLRNVGMLLRVASEILKRHPDIVIDALVPAHRRVGEKFEKLLKLPNISWHDGLDDQQLLSLYQKAYLLLLPMSQSSANTAVVEALSCGLPIVTTDVGGVRDYGGGTAYPIVANDDDEAMMGLVGRYLDEPAFRKEIASASRQFAVEKLSWPVIAGEHKILYENILS
jgi:glycosyltransferase involved in cell wall biosynthesis